MYEINAHNINEIRFNCCETNFTFLNEEFNSLTIPEQSKHQHLIKKFNIPNSILNFYHSRVKYSIKNYGLSKFQNQFNFIHADTLFDPFSIIINGAFWDKINLCHILTNFENETYSLNGKKVKSLETLKPIFKEYSNGFKKGFYEFEKNKIEPYLNTFSDKQDFFKLVFQFITGKKLFGKTWYTVKGLSMNMDREINIHSGFELGLLFGNLYKAWSIIFSNNSNFTMIFEEQTEIRKTQPNKSQKPELDEALISFKSPEIIKKLHKEMKGYFQNKEAELERAFQGEQLAESLLFPHHQNKFVEVFKRLKYNGYLLSTPKEIENWICSNFYYQYKKGKKKEVREFNTSTVHDILTKDKGEPQKKERICTTEWLPYKGYLTRLREAEKEQL